MVSPPLTELQHRFAALIRRLGSDGDPSATADEVLAAWAGPGRRYHDLGHLRDTLARLDEAAATGGDHDRIEAALWFHDAVYDSRAGDNELRSAAWARRALGDLGVPAAVVEDVARLVLLTQDHQPTDLAGELLCDIDLSILGRSSAEFERYDRRIREEYSWVAEDAYREARRGALESFLRRQPLYRTAHFRSRYEASARTNLERALAALRRPS